MHTELLQDCRPAAARASRPARLGFLGVGWIGRLRLQALLDCPFAEIAALADESPAALEAAQALAPRAEALAGLDALLARPLDGLVIATPSALHAAQAEAALARGLAVFCQKPLALDAGETASVIAAARKADRLLAVDLSYRHSEAMRCVHALVESGGIGEIYAADLVFHNAYGPDKPWFRDRQLSGGGCVIDLGTHLVDLALWTLGASPVVRVSSRLWAQGRRLPVRPLAVEDHAIAEIEFGNGAVARLACSWNLSAGCDAVIEARFHGTRGSACARNVDGSFYDFVAEHHEGTRCTRLASPPDAWGGRALQAWARALAAGRRFDPSIEQLAAVAAVVDAIYGR